jgi:hypothetical protein
LTTKEKRIKNQESTTQRTQLAYRDITCRATRS